MFNHISLVALPPLTSAALIFTVGAFVYRRRPESPVHRTFGLFCLSLTVWLGGFGLMYASQDAASALWWARTAFLGVPFIPPTMYHFVLIFLGLRRPRVLAALYLSGVIGLLLSQTDLIYNGIWVAFWGYYPVAGPLYAIFPSIFLFCFVGGVVRLWAALKQEVDQQRRQRIKYVMLAFAFATPGAVDYLGKFRLSIYPCGYLAALAFISLIAYAIVRHRLMDIEVVIRTSLIYSILIALITATYFAILVLVERTLQELVGYRSAVGSVLAAFVIALGFIPVHNAVQHWVDRLFFGGSQAVLAEENERLRQELTQSERLKAVAILASGLAHEIKNPLAAIKTFTEYLPEKYQDPAFHQKFQRIVLRELDKIQGIVANLLTFAKPQPVRRERVALGDVVQETVMLLNGDCLKRRIEIEVSGDPSATVLGDRTHLKQALLNLCLNSLDAMPEGGRLRIGMIPNGRHVSLSVEDTGVGIEAKQLPYVFDPFFTTKPAGTGLGLSVVHGIIKDHGGRILVQSQSGQGTTVSIELPVS